MYYNSKSGRVKICWCPHEKVPVLGISTELNDFINKIKVVDMTYLLQSPRSDVPQVDHVPGYAQHGRQRREPPKHVRPPRVLVVHVLDRLPLHQVEYEHAL